MINTIATIYLNWFPVAKEEGGKVHQEYANLK